MKTQTAVSGPSDNVVRDAMGFASEISIEDMGDLTTELGMLQNQLLLIKELEGNVFGIEISRKNEIASKKLELNNRIEQIKAIKRRGRYPLFNIEPLKWRDDNGLPALSVFSLDQPTSGMFFNATKLRFDLSLPSDMQACYADLIAKHAEFIEKIKAKSENSIVLRARFNGLIPQAVRQEIDIARNVFQGIYIIAESPGWKIESMLSEEAFPVPDADPLVVGHDGINYWLIASFDTTSLEEYIKSEFCVKTEPPKEAK